MALQTALATALRNRTIRNSSGSNAQLQDTGNTSNPLINTSVMRQYNPNYNPNVASGVSGIMGTGYGNMNPGTNINGPTLPAPGTSTPGTGTTGNVSTSGTTGIQPTGTQDANLASYEQSLGITPADKAARDKAYQDLIAANTEAGKYSSSDYYNQLVQQLGRTQEAQKISDLQAQEAEMRGAIGEQNIAASQGGEGMLRQAQQNAARALPLNQVLATNIAKQNLEVNKLSNIDQQISLQMQLKSADMQNKVRSIQANLDALKGKVPDYMLNYANQQLQQKMAEQTAKMQDTLKNGDINSTDPFIRKKAIQNSVAEVFKNYEGMPFTSTQSAHVENISKLVDSGMSLQDAIQQDIINPLQSKTEYKDFIAKKMGTQDKYDYKPIQGTDANGHLVTTGYIAVNKLDPTDYRMVGVDANGMPQKGTGGITGQIPTNITDYIKSKEGFRDKAYKDAGGKWTIGYGFTTRADGSPVQPGDTIDQKTADKMLQDKISQYQNFTNKIIVPLTNEQKMALTSFEYNLGKNIWDGDAKPIIDKINAGDFAGAAEYMKKFNTVKGTVVNGLTSRRNEEANLLTSGTSKQYSDAQLGVLSSIDSLTPTTLKALRDSGLSTTDYGLFKNGGLPPTSSQVSSAKTMVDKIDSLLNHPNLSSAVGPVDYLTPTISGKTNDFINKFNAFIANLAKDNLGVLKGPMSDKDVQFIKDMSTTLNRNSDEQSFKENLNVLRNKYAAISEGKSLNQATQAQLTQESQNAEGATSTQSKAKDLADKYY